jgi:hypothetical protein
MKLPGIAIENGLEKGLEVGKYVCDKINLKK